MREIKFRGMLRSGEWVYGGYVKIKDGANCILSGDIDCYDVGGNQKKNVLRFNVVKYKTVGQYTGRKDKNGKGIYEGDIISNEDYIEDAHCCFNLGNKIVEWNNECGCWLGIEGEIFKVIGNIHENPKLLDY